jgi:hypothetical protein
MTIQEIAKELKKQAEEYPYYSFFRESYSIWVDMERSQGAQ